MLYLRFSSCLNYAFMSRNYAMTSLDEYKIFKNTRHGCVWWRLSRPHVKLFTIRIVT